MKTALDHLINVIVGFIAIAMPVAVLCRVSLWHGDLLLQILILALVGVAAITFLWFVGACMRNRI